MADIKDDLAALRINREFDPPPRRGWLWTARAIVIAAIAFGAWRWFARDRPVAVETAVVTERGAGMQAAVLNASGYVTARRRATVSSKITGKVIEVNVEEGMSVHEGQVLARLDASSFVAALALAEAQAEAARRAVRENEVRLEDARRTLRRRTQLVQDKLVTEADLDTARADVDSLDARIGAARAQVAVAERQIEVERTNLDNAVIRAPFSGVAISKDAQPGEMVSPVSAGGGFTRTGISTIVDMRSLEIEVDVNESYINRVKPQQPVTAILDAYPEWQIPAHVITTVPSADRQKATVLVRIAFDHAAGPGSPRAGSKPEALDARILPDMGVKVTFLRDDQTERAPSTAVRLAPKAAIATEDGEMFIFVVNNGAAERRTVKAGGADGDRVEVLEGVAPGERVVLSPPPTLKPGDKVTGK